MTTFKHVDPNDPNIDIDVHRAPPGLWSRVAVVGLWSSKEKIRKAWPDAAVVGPLRTERGIDLLLRSLLANPQIRVVVIDGPDLRPDVTARLHAFFAAGTDPITGDETQILSLPEVDGLFASLPEHIVMREPKPGHPLFETLAFVARRVSLLTKAEWENGDNTNEGALAAHVPDEDRAGGTWKLPAPRPTDLDDLPHGDPGQRVVGDTLAEVWPRALEQAMRFGRKAMTQYGETREVLALTSVIRDPVKTLDEFKGTDAMSEKHPILGFSYGDIEAYYRQITTSDKGARDYSYGSRLRGKGYVIGSVTDQIAAVEKLLSEKPDTRAAFLTPWRPEEDSGKESGRPCLDGVRFRAVDGALHMFVTFRSHDVYAGHPQNLAALCLWLVEMAKKLHMLVGTLTCTSWSAHVYARDYAAVLDVVKANPAPMITWDQRSSWRIRTKPGPEVEGLTCKVRPPTATNLQQALCGQPAAGLDSVTTLPVCAEHAPVNAGPWKKWHPEQPMSVWGRSWPWGAGAAVVGVHGLQGIQAVTQSPTSPGSRPVWLESSDTVKSAKVKADAALAEITLLPLPRERVLVAEALTPGEDGGDRVIWSTEAPTPGALRLAIDRSGLCTSIGAAIWIGSEIERVWRTT